MTAFVHSLMVRSSFAQFVTVAATRTFGRTSTFQIAAPTRNATAVRGFSSTSMQYGDESDAGTKVFVGNISWSFSDDDLYETFQPYGVITDARIITDRESGRSRGFGFVTFQEMAEAQTAVAEMNGRDVDGRPLTVNVAVPREPRAGGGGGGGFRGGRGRGGGGYGGGRRDGGYSGRGGDRDGGYGRGGGRDRF